MWWTSFNPRISRKDEEAHSKAIVLREGTKVIGRYCLYSTRLNRIRKGQWRSEVNTLCHQNAATANNGHKENSPFHLSLCSLTLDVAIELHCDRSIYLFIEYIPRNAEIFKIVIILFYNIFYCCSSTVVSIFLPPHHS